MVGTTNRGDGWATSADAVAGTAGTISAGEGGGYPVGAVGEAEAGDSGTSGATESGGGPAGDQGVGGGGASGCAPCPGGYGCDAGACKTSCSTDADCAPDHFCSGTQCRIDAVEVSVGDAHACIVLADGTVRCWGSNQHGQLGTTSAGDSSTPAPVQNLTNVKSVAAGSQQTLAVLTDGTVVAWGRRVTDYDTSTSTSSYTSSAVPSPIQNLGGVRDIAVSPATDRFCALMQDGTVKQWGVDTAENGSATFSAVPYTVQGLSGVSNVTMGSGFDCALTAGTVQCWGWGTEGELGNNASNWAAPTLVAGFAATPTKMSSGYYHSCVVLTSGSVQCWGANGSTGDLGQPASGDPGGQFSSGAPTLISGLTNVSDVVLGEDTSCVILSTGGMRCWGGDQYGQLGDGTSRDHSITPVDVQGLAGKVVAGSGGLYSNCALLENGSVQCWGQAIGDSTIFNTRPVAVW